MPTFTKYGEKSLHNRKELLSWLDKIIDDTQRAHNFHLVSDDEDVLSAGVAPGSPVNLPIFITFRSCSYFSIFSRFICQHWDVIEMRYFSWDRDQQAMTQQEQCLPDSIAGAPVHTMRSSNLVPL